MWNPAIIFAADARSLTTICLAKARVRHESIYFQIINRFSRASIHGCILNGRIDDHSADRPNLATAEIAMAGHDDT